MKKHKVTKKDFEAFAEHAHKWLDVFGLTDWHVIIVQAEEPDAFATVSYDADKMKACITLTTCFENWQENMADFDPARHAFHEVMHLVLAPLIHCEQRERDRESHRIIYKLEKLFDV